MFDQCNTSKQTFGLEPEKQKLKMPCRIFSHRLPEFPITGKLAIKMNGGV